MQWNEQALKAAMETYMMHNIQFILEQAKIVPLFGYNVWRSYRKVWKVRIMSMKGVWVYIEFARKLSTNQKPREQCDQRFHKAMICHVAHSGIIKFWAIHTQSIEAYILWSNGGSRYQFLQSTPQHQTSISPSWTSRCFIRKYFMTYLHVTFCWPTKQLHWA